MSREGFGFIRFGVFFGAYYRAARVEGLGLGVLWFMWPWDSGVQGAGFHLRVFRVESRTFSGG